MTQDPAMAVNPSSQRAAPLDRVQILDATEACLNEMGYDGATIRQIAKRLRCAVGSIYRFFPDKRSLLASVTQRRFEPVLSRIDLGEPVADSVALYQSIAQAEPEQYRLMFWLSSIGRTDAGPAVPGIVVRIVEGWSKQLGDPAKAQRVWAMLHGGLMLGQPEIAQELLGGAAPVQPVVLVDASGKPRDATSTKPAE